MPVVLLAISAAASVYGAVESSKSARNAAKVDTATANYNARLDEAMSKQLDLDTQKNIQTERKANAIYLSKQEASYASAGVLSNSGSALDAQLTNAGIMEQKIQQDQVNLSQKQQQYASSARAGRLEGSARAESDRAQGNIALINSTGRLASMGYNAYSSGVFSGQGSKTVSGFSDPYSGD
jgi:hypothetical protein